MTEFRTSLIVWCSLLVTAGMLLLWERYRSPPRKVVPRKARRRRLNGERK